MSDGNEPEEKIEGGPDGPARWGVVLGGLALASAAACLLMIVRFGRFHLEAALYVTGMVAALGTGCGIVAYVRRRKPPNRTTIIAAIVTGALALTLTIWVHAAARERVDLERRVAAVRQVLRAFERHAAAVGGLPAHVNELEVYGLSADVLAKPPGGGKVSDYVFTQAGQLTREQLEKHRAGRKVILLHDGGAEGREPTVVGMLGGEVRDVSWGELSEKLEQQSRWIHRLRVRIDRATSAPATEPSTRPADDGA